MKSNFTLILLNSFVFWLASQTCSLAGGPVLDANEFGLANLGPDEDATPVFRKAMEACRSQHASGLKIPSGTWHLYPDYAFEAYLAVANNNPGMKRIVFQLDRLKDFAIIGEDARFVCHGELIPFSVDDAENITLQGIRIDWSRSFHFQGEVVAVHHDKNAFDLKVHDEVFYELRGQRLIFREKPSRSPHAWKEWAPPPTQHMSWEHNLQWNMWFDGETRHPIPGEHQWALEPDARVEEVEPRVIRIYDAVHLMPQVGWVVAVKGMVDPNRTSPAVRVARSKKILLEDVAIHHAGGMGVIMQRTEDITLRNLRVELPEGKNRMVTTTADATHFNGCRGSILIEDCLFENMLDDATNVHGCFVRVDKVMGNNLICRRIHSQQRGLIVMTAGDRVRFQSSDDMQAYGDSEVLSTRELNADLFEVTLDRLPEDGVREGSALYSLTWQPELTIRNCTVRNHRARTMLIATAEKVLIEDNRFLHSSMAGIQFEGDNGFWWESGPTRDVTIRGNLFLNNAGAALRIMPQINHRRFPDALYHGGIVFEDNVIESFHRRVVEGVAIDGLIFRGNTIRMIDHVTANDYETPSFAIETGRNIRLEDNVFEGQPPLKIAVSTKSAAPVLKGNSGISSSIEFEK